MHVVEVRAETGGSTRRRVWRFTLWRAPHDNRALCEAEGEMVDSWALPSWTAFYAQHDTSDGGSEAGPGGEMPN